MKVIICMAITLDGYIAKRDGSYPFVTAEESERYDARILEAKHVVMGRKTYDEWSSAPEFKKFKESGVRIVVVSREPLRLPELTATSPAEALSHFGHGDTVIVAGGGILNASFLKENLVDELYIDIAPSMLGAGVPLFGNAELEKQFELLNIEKFGSELELHYKVVR